MLTTPASHHADSLPWPVKIETGDGSALAGDLTAPTGAQAS